MHRSGPTPSPLSLRLIACLVLLALALVAGPAPAQTLLADYPFLTDLLDATTNHGATTLTGNPTPPAAPANGVCHNGIYRYATNGQDIRTPDITKLDATDFMFEVEFRLAALPTSTRGFPVIMAGNGWRWIGIYVSPTGVVGIKYNNSNQLWSKTTVALKRWYSAVLMYEKGKLKLLLDGIPIFATSLPALNTGSNKNFTTNDFSNGLAFHGCIRRLRIWNDANLTGGLFTLAGSRCHGLTIGGATPWPQATRPYRVTVSGGSAGLPAVLLLGRRQPTALDLTALGAPGCHLFVSPLVVFSTALDPAGAAAVLMPMPPLPGVSARFQWACLDPRANPLQVRLSDYATLVVGR